MKFSENRPLAWAVLFVCVLVSIVLFGGLGLREDRQSVEEVFYTGADDAYFSLNGYIDRRAAAAQKLAAMGLAILGDSDTGALALSAGIALQNFPEGAVISMPLHSEGMSKARSFVYGVLSGAVEPAGASLMLLLSGLLLPVMPYALSFAAGAMIYVVVEELIPEMSEGRHSNVGTMLFAAGFTLMIALDILIG